MPSPIYLSTKPRCSWMMSLIAERYSFMKCTRSGGASASAIDENPAMSEKKMVTLRISPPSAGGSDHFLDHAGREIKRKVLAQEAPVLIGDQKSGSRPLHQG